MKLKKLAFCGCFLAFELMLAYAETLIPLPFPAGVKLGLANTAAVTMLYATDLFSAIFVSLIRVVLSGILFTNPVTVIYGAAGAVLSLVGMYFLIKLSAGTLTVSVCGALLHNAAQLFVACLMTSSTSILLYAPVLVISAIVCGAAVAVICIGIKKPLARFADTSGMVFFSKKDIVFYAVFALFIGGCSAALLSGRDTAYVTVRENGKVIATYPLDRDFETVIETEYGSNTLSVKDGVCRVTDSDCPNGDCLKMKIDKNGGMIVCLPHRLSVTAENSDADAVTG